MPTQRFEERRVEERLGEGERERKHFGSSFHMFLPPPEPALCKLGLGWSAVCSTWNLHSGPRTCFSSIIAGFALPCLLATAILDSFSLFYLPNIPPSRDGRPNFLGIGVSRSFWLLPAELGWWGVLGLPLLPVSSLRVLIAVSILGCDIFHGRLEFSIFAELALHVVACWPGQRQNRLENW